MMSRVNQVIRSRVTGYSMQHGRGTKRKKSFVNGSSVNRTLCDADAKWQDLEGATDSRFLPAAGRPHRHPATTAGWVPFAKTLRAGGMAPYLGAALEKSAASVRGFGRDLGTVTPSSNTRLSIA